MDFYFICHAWLVVHKERNNWHTYDSDSSVLHRASFLCAPFLFMDTFTAFPFSWKKNSSPHKTFLFIFLCQPFSCQTHSVLTELFICGMRGCSLFLFQITNLSALTTPFGPLVSFFLCFLFFLCPPPRPVPVLCRWMWFIHSRRAKRRCLGPCVASPPWSASRTTQKLFLALPM